MANDVAIRVTNLSKEFRIGKSRGKFRYKSLRDSIASGVAAPFRRAAGMVRGNAYAAGDLQESFWALKDVSFEVKQGEAVGVIGRNGAGKSTLLKILSEITEPSEGEVELHGRVGSLLEVGTGFHPELTGRDNIYLNGAILGMKRAEIHRKFDEIVDFAEVEKFIDTPVKHYSSGMYVRLAFAVAAHLEPEILVVDEVLAVGDAAFQKKCLGKMGDVAKGGRTVLFVSHNMQAIQSLCDSGVLLHSGRVLHVGNASSIVAKYLESASDKHSKIVWDEDSRPGNAEFRLTSICVSSEDGNTNGIYSSKSSTFIDFEFSTKSKSSALCVGFDLVTSEGNTVLRSYQTDMAPERWPSPRMGENRWRCIIPAGFLNAGTYEVFPRISIHNSYWIVNTNAGVRFEMVLDHGVSPFWNSLYSRNRPGVVSPVLNWSENSQNPSF